MKGQQHDNLRVLERDIKVSGSDERAAQAQQLSSTVSPERASKGSDDPMSNITSQRLSRSMLDWDSKDPQSSSHGIQSLRTNSQASLAIGSKLPEKKSNSYNRRSWDHPITSATVPAMTLADLGPPREICFRKKTADSCQSHSIGKTMIGTNRARFVEVASCSPNLSFQGQPKLPFLVDPQYPHRESTCSFDSSFSNARQDALEKRIDLSMKKRGKTRSMKKPSSNTAATRDSEDSSEKQPSKQISCP